MHRAYLGAHQANHVGVPPSVQPDPPPLQAGGNPRVGLQRFSAAGSGPSGLFCQNPLQPARVQPSSTRLNPLQPARALPSSTRLNNPLQPAPTHLNPLAGEAAREPAPEQSPVRRRGFFENRSRARPLEPAPAKPRPHPTPSDVRLLTFLLSVAGAAAARCAGQTAGWAGRTGRTAGHTQSERA